MTKEIAKTTEGGVTIGTLSPEAIGWNYLGKIERLEAELAEARRFGVLAWKFIEYGCFFDEVEMGEDESPDRELWIRHWVLRELAEEYNWLKEKEQE